MVWVRHNATQYILNAKELRLIEYFILEIGFNQNSYALYGLIHTNLRVLGCKHSSTGTRTQI